MERVDVLRVIVKGKNLLHSSHLCMHEHHIATTYRTYYHDVMIVSSLQTTSFFGICITSTYTCDFETLFKGLSTN